MHKQSLTCKQCRGRGGPIWVKVSGLRICSRPMKVREREGGGRERATQIKAHRGKLEPLALFLCNSCTFTSLHLTSWHIRPAGPARAPEPARERAGGGEGARVPALSKTGVWHPVAGLQGEPGYEPHILLREQPKITKEG